MLAIVTKSQLLADDSIHQPFENGTTHHSQTTWSWSWSSVCCHFFFNGSMHSNNGWKSHLNLQHLGELNSHKLHVFLCLGCLNVANHSNLSSHMVFSCLPCSLHLYAFNMTCFQRSWYLNSKGEKNAPLSRGSNLHGDIATVRMSERSKNWMESMWSLLFH